MSKKLSQWMEEGAALTLPGRNTYINRPDNDGEIPEACALGAARYAMALPLYGDGTDDYSTLKGYPNVTSVVMNRILGYDPQLTMVSIHALPEDVFQVCPAAAFTNDTINLHTVITSVNDAISRERAIAVTHELGY